MILQEKMQECMDELDGSVKKILLTLVKEMQKHELAIILPPWYRRYLNFAPYNSGLHGIEDRKKLVVKILVKIPERLGDVWLCKYPNHSESKYLGSVYMSIPGYIGIS